MKRNMLAPLIAICVILLGLSVGSFFFTPDRTFSENENRYLQTTPELTADSVLSGRFIMNRGRICPAVNITPVMYALKRTLLISPKSSTSPSDSRGRDSHGRVSAAIVRKCSPCQSS